MSTTFVRGENPLRADKLNEAFDERVARDGDTMEGPLILYRDPVVYNEAATKQYADFQFAAARSAARMQIQWPTGTVAVNGTVHFVYDTPYTGMINSMTHYCTTGSFAVDVQINGVSVTGLSVTPTDTPTTTNATAARTFTAGQRISAVITGATGSPTSALLSLNVTWT